MGGSLPTCCADSFDTPLDYIQTIFSLSLSTFTFYFYFPQKVKVKPSVRMVLIWVSRESPRRMWLNGNSGWSLSPTQFWESKDSKFGKLLFRKGLEWVNKVSCFMKEHKGNKYVIERPTGKSLFDVERQVLSKNWDWTMKCD